MNIDDALRITLNERRTEYLHVTGEHDEIDPALLQQLQLPALLLRPVFGCDRQMDIINPESLRGRLHVGVVADNQRNLDPPFTRLIAGQQIVKAMRLS